MNVLAFYGDDATGWRLEAGNLRLGFERAVDGRWVHALAVVGAEGPAVVRSLEGDHDRDDPRRVVSPVYQDMRVEPADDRRSATLFALGKSGPHHFSAVFSMAADPVAGTWSLTVDLADRCRGPVESLAATYAVDRPGGSLVEAGPGGLAWDLGNGTALRFAADPPGRVALAEAGRRAAQVQADAPIDPATNTHRLQYRWGWAPATG